jgi:hypothetical protein
MSSANSGCSPVSKRRWGFLVALATLLGLAIVWFLLLQHHATLADRELRAVVAKVDATDPGWQLKDLETARERVPGNENGALIVRAAYRRLPKNCLSGKEDELWAAGAFPPDRMSKEQAQTLRQVLIAVERNPWLAVEARRCQAMSRPRTMTGQIP